MNTEAQVEVKERIKGEPEVDDQSAISQGPEGPKSAGIKRELSDGEVPPIIPPSDSDLKPEGEERANPGVVFKKRKAKNIRQK
jgi:hypothetical protein